VTDLITVSDNTLEGQVATLARYLLTSIGGFALGKGWIDGDVLQLLTGLLTIGLPTAYGIWKTYRAKQLQIALADAAPNTKAQVVSKT
jgi:hypothetical protein